MTAPPPDQPRSRASRPAHRGVTGLTLMLACVALAAARGSSAPPSSDMSHETISISRDGRYRLSGSVSIAAPQREISRAAGYRLEGGVVGVLDEHTTASSPNVHAPRWPVLPAPPRP